MITHYLSLALDRCVNEITLYADEDRAQIEAGEHILIGWTGGGVGQRSRPCHYCTHEPVNGARPVHFPYGRSIQENSGARDIPLKHAL